MNRFSSSGPEAFSDLATGVVASASWRRLNPHLPRFHSKSCMGERGPNAMGTRPRGRVKGNEGWPRRRRYAIKGARP
jgi:hypothetical protein